MVKNVQEGKKDATFHQRRKQRGEDLRSPPIGRKRNILLEGRDATAASRGARLLFCKVARALRGLLFGLEAHLCRSEVFGAQLAQK